MQTRGQSHRGADFIPRPMNGIVLGFVVEHYHPERGAGAANRNPRKSCPTAAAMAKSSTSVVLRCFSWPIHTASSSLAMNPAKICSSGDGLAVGSKRYFAGIANSGLLGVSAIVKLLCFRNKTVDI